MDFRPAFLVFLMICFPAVDVTSPSALNDSIRQERSRAQRQRFKRKPVSSSSEQSVTTIVKGIMKNYNKQEPPTRDRATLVSLGIYVISFYSISEQTMDYSVSMYLRQTWTDPRLSFISRRKKTHQIRLGDGMWNEIWIPDTFLRNEKAANFHLVTVENRMLQLKASGTLWYVTKITATLSCPMFLQKFPLDTQVCPMLFESFGYTMDTLYFQAMPMELGKAVEVAGDLQLPQFLFLKSDVHDCSQNYTTGAYPCLEFRFFLRRDLGYFLIQVYVPSILIVILSWVSFWINVDASPARVSIGLLTVLATTTMSSSARATLPKVSYIKAIDVWMIICLLFVFLSLIEYAIVNVLVRKPARLAAAAAAANAAAAAAQKRRSPCLNHHHQLQQYQRAPKREPAHETIMNPIPRKTMSGLNCFKINIHEHHPAGGASVSGGNTSSSGGSSDDGKAEARQVDKMSRKIFPTTFVIFNLIYWIVYAEPFSADPIDEIAEG